MNAEVFHYVPGIGKDIHQVRNRRPLIATDITDAGLQQRFGDGENPLAAKDLASPELQVFDLSRERTLCHLLSAAPQHRRLNICKIMFPISEAVNLKFNTAEFKHLIRVGCLKNNMLMHIICPSPSDFAWD